MEKTINKKEMMSIFNLNTPDPANKAIDIVPYSEHISEFLSPEEFSDLKERLKSSRQQNIHNISNKKSEEQKVIRIKAESLNYLQELFDQLTAMGLPIKLSVLVEYLLLKAMKKI